MLLRFNEILLGAETSPPEEPTCDQKPKPEAKL